MTVRTSAGTTLKVSHASPATHDGAGFAALVFSTVGEITDMGEFGREYNLVTHNPIDTRGTQKYKGSFNEGSITLQLGLDTDDTGQIKLKEGLNSDNDYSFKVTTQGGDVYYFTAKVMSFKVGIGSVDSITSATVMLEITTAKDGSGVIEVLAA